MSEPATVEIYAGGDVTEEQLADHESLLRRAVEAALAGATKPGAPESSGFRVEHDVDATISLTLVDDMMMRALNLQFLQRDHVTDVMAFPLYEPGQPMVGDVYIGFGQAYLQARELGIPVETELARLAIHGTLHVLGYDHPEDARRESSEMWTLQEQILGRVLRGQ